LHQYAKCKPLPVGQGEIDGKVKAFLDRPIEGDWPDLWIDATYVKVRNKTPKLAALMDEAETDALAYMAFPAAHRLTAGRQEKPFRHK